MINKTLASTKINYIKITSVGKLSDMKVSGEKHIFPAVKISLYFFIDAESNQIANLFRFCWIHWRWI